MVELATVSDCFLKKANTVSRFGTCQHASGPELHPGALLEWLYCHNSDQHK